MRLLAVHPVDHPGGAEVGFLRLALRLRDRGWDITMTTPGEDEPLFTAGFRHLKLDVGGLGAGEGARAVASWPRALLLARDADVVYLNSTVCGRLLPALRHAFTVLHVHDIVDRVPRHWHHANVVLADSAAVAERLTGLDARVVHCPVELDPPAADVPWAVHPTGSGAATPAGPIIGFVGRIEPRKGVIDLVHAAPVLRKALPGARIIVIGDDPYATNPRYLAEVRGSTDVEHLPWVANAPGIMRHLDVLVAPSHQEPFGTVLSEAMAVGTPVVATRVGGLAEVVDDGVNGVLVAPGDPPALADAVLRVLSDRIAMGTAARASAQRFGADAYADRVEALITP
ncbi:MAG: glycosyltransferase family 4 protein [Solirubrobacterales bacterium]|nr:glycosyltransferase family 4 protein [Solirubrobacterales bacterium]